MFKYISLSSFHHEYANFVAEFNKNNKEKIEFGFLYHKKLIFDFFRFDVENTSLNMYYSDVTKERCDKAHKNGMAVIAWFRLNDAENEDIYKYLFDSGVDCIISNFPKRAKEYRDYYFKKQEKMSKYYNYFSIK